MSQIIVKKIESDDERVLPFLFASQQIRLAQEGEILAAMEGEIICGAIGIVQEDKTMEILSLYVEEGFRRRGAGSLLLKEAVQRAAAQGMGKISLSYSGTEEQTLPITAFFLNNGFPQPVPGEVLYTVSMDSIDRSIFASQKLFLKKIESDISEIFRLPSVIWEKNKIPDYMLPDRVPGNLLRDLSLAYADKEGIRACIVMCDTGRGIVHLHSAFLETPNYGGYLVGLLQKAFSIIREKYPHFQRLTVTGATEEGKRLIEHLLLGAEMTVQTAYTVEYPLNQRGGFRPVGFYGTLARFHTLADALAERGIASRLSVSEGGMSYMELEVQGLRTPLKVYYEVLGEEAYNGFVLKIFFELTAELEDNGKLKGIEWEEYLTENMDILENEEEGNILLFGSYEETPAYDAEESIEQFLIPFSICVEKLVKRIG